MATAFAGPLCRWYARDGDPSRLRPGVEAWREDLRGAVADKVRAQLEWDEAGEFALATDLGDSGWLALRLFALYSERSELDWPDTVPPLLELDPHWRAAADGKFPKTLYGQLLACRGWLPGDFPVTLRVPLPDGESAELGSIGGLVDQLRWLNQRTFQADAEDLRAWCQIAAPAGGELLQAARRGYAALWTAAEAAQASRLPLMVREG
jgi:hypothetical protein